VAAELVVFFWIYQTDERHIREDPDREMKLVKRECF